MVCSGWGFHRDAFLYVLVGSDSNRFLTYFLCTEQHGRSKVIRAQSPSLVLLGPQFSFSHGSNGHYRTIAMDLRYQFLFSCLLWSHCEVVLYSENSCGNVGSCMRNREDGKKRNILKVVIITSLNSFFWLIHLHLPSCAGIHLYPRTFSALPNVLLDFPLVNREAASFRPWRPVAHRQSVPSS
jgi:hypothetical protein